MSKHYNLESFDVFYLAVFKYLHGYSLLNYSKINLKKVTVHNLVLYTRFMHTKIQQKYIRHIIKYPSYYTCYHKIMPEISR